MNVKIISAILVLAFASMACGFSIDLPSRAQPGPDVKESITVKGSGSEDAHLKISFGAGKLMLSPGAKNLVDGTVVYNYPELKPEVLQENDSVEIRQGEFRNLVNPNDIHNEWDLQLGKTPIDLTINAGAYQGIYDLGGLPLTNLTVQDGAADVELSFSKPNPIEMSVMRYQTGASSVKLSGLANANFSSLMFSGGAGDYTLDFSGELQRDATITIEAGFGDLNIVIPDGLDAKMTVDGAAVDINHDSGWSQSGNVYTQEGEGHTLTFIVEMAAGSLSITD